MLSRVDRPLREALPFSFAEGLPCPGMWRPGRRTPGSQGGTPIQSQLDTHDGAHFSLQFVFGVKRTVAITVTVCEATTCMSPGALAPGGESVGYYDGGYLDLI